MHLVQPCENSVTQILKQAWTTHRENHKMDAAAKGKWKDVSGLLLYPLKRFFLNLAAHVFREVNIQRDKNGLIYAWKATILTGDGFEHERSLEWEPFMRLWSNFWA